MFNASHFLQFFQSNSCDETKLKATRKQKSKLRVHAKGNDVCIPCLTHRFV